MNNYRTFGFIAIPAVIAFWTLIWVVNTASHQPVNPVLAEAASTTLDAAKPTIHQPDWQSILDSINLEPRHTDVDTDQEQTSAIDNAALEDIDDVIVTNTLPQPDMEPQVQLIIVPSYSENRLATSSNASSLVSSASGGGTSSSGLSSGGLSSGGSSSGGSSTNSGLTATASTDTNPPAGVNNESDTPDLTELTKPSGIANIFYVPKEITYNNALLPVSVAMNNLSKYDAFWRAWAIAERSPELWRTLRTVNPDKLALHYVSSFTVRPDAPVSYLDFDYIERYHPEWFLLKDEKNAVTEDYRNWDKRIRWNPSDPEDWRYNRFFLDIGNRDFQVWAANEFLKKLNPVSGVNARIPYSGLGMDNVLLTFWPVRTTKLYPNWKYASVSVSEWNKLFISYLKIIHARIEQNNYLLVANATLDYSSNRDGSDWQDLMDSVDGLMHENALAMVSTSTVWGNDMFGDDKKDYWDSCMAHHEEILKKGLYDWWVFTPHKEDIETDEERNKFLYVYGSFLLVKSNQYSLFGIVREKDGTFLNPWYEELTLPLGNPVGLRYQRNDCWLRDYQYGKVVINPSDKRCTITLDSDTYMLDWRTKKRIAELTLESYSATILLPTGYTVK